MPVLRAILFWAVAPLATAVGAVLGLLLLPLAPRTARAAHVVERVWGRLVVLSAGGWIVVEGREKIDPRRSRLIVANHQSFLDPPALIAALPARLRFVLKRELGRLPFLGWYVALTGHFLLDRSDPREGAAVLERAVERARRRGMSAFVFPEGTRSRDGNLGPLKAGSFQLALAGGFDVQPVAVLGTRAILPKGARVPRRFGTVRIRVGDPIAIEGLEGSSGRKALAERVRAALVALGVPEAPAVPEAGADPS